MRKAITRMLIIKVEGDTLESVVITDNKKDKFGRLFCAGEDFAAPWYPEQLRPLTPEEEIKNAAVIAKIKEHWV